MKLVTIVSLLFCLCFPAGQVFASDGQSGSGAPEKSMTSPFAVGVAARVSTLGVGADVALSVTRRTNVRVGFNFFDYDGTFKSDEVSYKGSLQLRSVQALYDVFPFRGNFHISPGVLVYNGNNGSANASVASGQTFSLGGVSYISNSTVPVTGKASVDVSKAAPMFLIGWGNLVPRSHRHLTFSIEGGLAYQGSPSVNLALNGNVCDPTGANCRNVATDPTVQSNVASEQRKIKNDLTFFQYYPVVSLGLGYRF